jgi:anti-sigma B factor antagonist
MTRADAIARVETARSSGGVHAVVIGELDCASAPSVAAAVRDLLDGAGPARPVTVDLSAVTFCDTAGMRVLVRLVQATAGDAVTVRLANAAGNVRWLFSLAGVEHLLEGPAGTSSDGG